MDTHPSTSASASSSITYSPTPPISLDGLASSSTFQGSFGTHEKEGLVNEAHYNGQYNRSEGAYGIVSGVGHDVEEGGIDRRNALHSSVICDNLWKVGFQAGMWSDIDVRVRDRSYKLHRIILSRSPYILHMLERNPPGHVLWLVIDDEDVTDAAVAIVIGHLYASYSYGMLTPSNAPNVLAASTLFGIPDLARSAYDICRGSIGVENILEWVQWCESRIPREAGVEGYGAVDVEYDPRGMSPPSSLVNGNGEPVNGGWGSPRPVAGDWVGNLRYDVQKFLTYQLLPNLPATALPTTHTSHPLLLSIIAQLPFDLFKSLIEDAHFALGSDQERFAFAKKAIVARRKAAAAIQGSNGPAAAQQAAGIVENVVLRFTGGKGSNVHVTRKMRTRNLWKVEKD